MVDGAIEILRSRAVYRLFGRLLNEGWTLKRRLSDRLDSDIDGSTKRRFVQELSAESSPAPEGDSAALRPAEDRPKVRSALPKLLDVPFRFETSGSESCCISRIGGRTARPGSRSGSGSPDRGSR
jgi:hypothetical protein